jgi:Pectate lyase superfamily protein
MAGAQNLLLNGLMQSDLDAANHKIINLDTSNLNIGGGPLPYPAVAHQWLRDYNDVTRMFSSSQPNILNGDIAGFPSLLGQSGKFLTNNGAVMSWANTQSAGSSGYINVKDAPFNAVGDGVHDDYQAIHDAIAGANGRTVYIPKGVYYLGQNLDVSLINAVVLVGDSAATSVLLARPDAGNAILTLGDNAFVSRLGFHGNMQSAVQPVPVSRVGIAVVNATNVVIRDCFVVYCASVGILTVACYGSVYIQNCSVAVCGLHAMECAQSPRTTIMNCAAYLCGGCGIFMVNSQQSIVKHNTVYQCARVSFADAINRAIAGVILWDSDNTVMDGNIIHQCGVGAFISTSPARPPALITYGYSVSSNVIIRNYFAGIMFILSNGFRFSGNNVIDNGQGGTDDATYTIEPAVLPTAAGSGYHAGDVLTVSGGTFSEAAKLIVLSVNGSGGITMVVPVTLGTYTVFPANPVSVTGGFGTGANFIMSGSRVLTGGSGYTRGQVLRASNGTNNGHAAKVIITNVDLSGAVLSYGILDGGGYVGSLPSSLSFNSDSLGPAGNPSGPDIPTGDTATGFAVEPNFGKLFSHVNDGWTSFGMGTLGPVVGGAMGGNIVDNNKGVGILVMDSVAPYNGRAQLLIISGNLALLNDFSIKGQTFGDPLDDNYAFNNMITNNYLYP